MRLVDADALIEAYDRAHEGEPGKARQLILDAPTIEERKTGKWIKEIEKWLDPDIDNELALERIRAIVYEMENET